MKTFLPAGLYINYRGGSYIPLNIFGLPKTIEVEGRQWFRKHEFHSSIVYVKRLTERVSKELGIEETEAFDRLCRATEESYDPKEQLRVTPTGELRYAKLDREGVTEESIITMVMVDGIEPLFARLRKLLSVDIPIPPTHITTYVIPDGAIGSPIPDEQALNERTRVLSDAALTEAKQAMHFDEVFDA